MSGHSIDLLVIGAGWSGLMAAYTAANAGLKVQVIAKGLGSMHWAAGSIDLFGYAPMHLIRQSTGRWSMSPASWPRSSHNIPTRCWARTGWWRRWTALLR